MHQSTPRTRLTALDGLRGLAALGVVLYHYAQHYRTAPWAWELMPLYKHGYLLVDLFFVLSGYILAEITIWRRRYPTAKDAVVARVRRLYPLHLVTLALTMALQLLHHALAGSWFMYTNNDPYHLLLNLLLLQSSGLETNYSFNGPSWSISTELIIGVVFLAVAVRGRAAGLLAALGLVAAPHALSLDPELARCAVGFGVGVIARESEAWLPTRPGWARDALWLLAAAASLVLLVTPIPAAVLPVFATLIITTRSGTRSERLISARPLVWLGEVSFAVYLGHFPVQIAVESLRLANGISSSVYEAPAVLVAYLVMTLGLALALRRWAETPAWVNSVARPGML